MTTLTHEIRLDGAPLVQGDETSINVIFNCLNGRNFTPPQPAWRTQTYAEYLFAMEDELQADFAGATIELAAIGQPASQSYQFPATLDGVAKPDCAHDGEVAMTYCDECGKDVDHIIGCPDGAEICQACFDAGAH